MIGRRKTPWTTCARFLWPSAHDGGMSGATPMLSAKGAGDPKAADQLLPLSLVETHAPDLPFRPGGAGLKIFSDSVACFPPETRLSELAVCLSRIETTNELEWTRIGKSCSNSRLHQQGRPVLSPRIRNTMTKARAYSTKICGCAFSSSPRDEGAGRGPRRGAIQNKRASSPRPAPPSDGGAGAVAALPRCVHWCSCVVELI